MPINNLLKPKKLPLDSMYLANMAADRADREQQGAGLIQQGQVDQTDTAEALRRLSMNRARAAQGFNANASRQGSLLSGKAVQGFGYQDTGYQRQQNDVQDQLARRIAGRTQSLAGLQQGGNLYEQQQVAQNAQRASDNAWNNRLPMFLAQQLAKQRRR